MCELPLAAASLHFSSAATRVIRSPPQQIGKASIFARCWSKTQQFSAEQIEWDSKSDTDTTLKHGVNFRIKHSMLTPDHTSLNFINKLSLCVEAGLTSTDQRFSEAAVTLSIVIINLKCSLNAGGRCGQTAEHRANMEPFSEAQWNPGVSFAKPLCNPPQPQLLLSCWVCRYQCHCVVIHTCSLWCPIVGFRCSPCLRLSMYAHGSAGSSQHRATPPNLTC